jgi:tRNA pseudouridine32 synthase/23S rRNA pseudouridine746 synthase
VTALEILHEDEWLVVVDKPAGVATAPGGGIGPGESLHERVAKQIGAKAFLVHRLDRETSGVIVFAKDAEMHRRLSQAFETREVGKAYLALVHGHVDEPSGEIAKPLKSYGSGRVGVDAGGQEAITRYRRRERLPDVDLLEVTPVTGRRHQIRVHLYAIGHPVIGDTRYGEERPVGGPGRLMLHAAELTLPSMGGPPLVVRADPPVEFTEALEAHR